MCVAACSSVLQYMQQYVVGLGMLEIVAVESVCCLYRWAFLHVAVCFSVAVCCSVSVYCTMLQG